MIVNSNVIMIAQSFLYQFKMMVCVWLGTASVLISSINYYTIRYEMFKYINVLCPWKAFSSMEQ